MHALTLMLTATTLLTFEAHGSDAFAALLEDGEAAFNRQDYGAARRRLREAEDLLRRSAPDAVQQARVHNARGALYLVEGKLTAAGNHLRRALALLGADSDPADSAAVLHNLAGVEMQSGELRQALQHELAGVELCRRAFGPRDTNLMKALVSLSTIQGLLSDWRAANATLQEVLSMEQSPAALANYAVVLERLGRGKEADLIRQRGGKTPVQPQSLVDVRALRSARQTLRARSQ